MEPTDAGCSVNGTLHFEPNNAKYAFNLNACAFTKDFTMTGTGSYDSDKDRFALTVATTGRWRCDLKYVRTARPHQGHRHVRWQAGEVGRMKAGAIHSGASTI